MKCSTKHKHDGPRSQRQRLGKVEQYSVEVSPEWGGAVLK